MARDIDRGPTQRNKLGPRSQCFSQQLIENTSSDYVLTTNSPRDQYVTEARGGVEVVEACRRRDSEILL